METNKKIGNVILDYSHYSDKFTYSDGEIEETILRACAAGTEDDLLKRSNEWAVLYHLSDIRENVIEWYPFREGAEVLEIGSGCGAITGILSEKSKSVTCVEISERRSMINAYRHKERDNILIKLGNFQEIEPTLEKYDYITLIGVWEYSGSYISSNNPFSDMLRIAKKHLKENGELIIAIENKMGIKYLNGAPEDHTGRAYDGINDYIGGSGVRTFSKNEVGSFLSEVGFQNIKFYFPVPDYKLPNVLFSDEYLPGPGSVRTYKAVYSQSRLYSFYEDVACDQLCADGEFDYMSNSFVVSAGTDNSNVVYARYNRERRERFRIATYIINENSKRKVIKNPLSVAAKEHIRSMDANMKKWNETMPNIACAKGQLIGDSYVSEFIYGKTLSEQMYEYRNDIELFIDKLKEIIDKYYFVSEEELEPFGITGEYIEVFGNTAPESAKSLKVTNVDMVLSNLLLARDGQLYAIDFEWVFDFPVPYRYVMWRAVKEIYRGYLAYLKPQMKEELFMQELSFSREEINIFGKMEKSFMEYVFGVGGEEAYTRQYRKEVIMQNIRFC